MQKSELDFTLLSLSFSLPIYFPFFNSFFSITSLFQIHGILLRRRSTCTYTHILGEQKKNHRCTKSFLLWSFSIPHRLILMDCAGIKWVGKKSCRFKHEPRLLVVCKKELTRFTFATEKENWDSVQCAVFSVGTSCMQKWDAHASHPIKVHVKSLCYMTTSMNIPRRCARHTSPSCATANTDGLADAYASQSVYKKYCLLNVSFNFIFELCVWIFLPFPLYLSLCAVSFLPSLW